MTILYAQGNLRKIAGSTRIRTRLSQHDHAELHTFTAVTVGVHRIGYIYLATRQNNLMSELCSLLYGQIPWSLIQAGHALVI